MKKLTKVSMTDLFPKCAEVLWEFMYPINYNALTLLGLGKLGIKEDEVEFFRVIEDVREKMLEAGRCESFYTGPPYYAGAIREWFEETQPKLFNDQAYLQIIPGSASVSVGAAFESVMRFPRMEVKNPNVPETVRARSCARGQIIETHISNYFKKRFKKFWLPPDNEWEFDQWCDHDFKLKVDEETYLVDAMGPRNNGTFGIPTGGGKRPADIHILGDIDGNNVRIYGFVKGVKLAENIPIGSTNPISRLLVWLTVKMLGQDYDGIRSKFTGSLPIGI